MTARAIILIKPIKKSSLHLNYSRRMYAVIRRYTPVAQEGEKNECFAELTGLRTFLKMSYQEIAKKIIDDIYHEIGVKCTVSIAKAHEYEAHSSKQKKQKSISTYSEMNSLFVRHPLIGKSKNLSSVQIKRVRLTVPFLGKVK